MIRPVLFGTLDDLEPGDLWAHPGTPFRVYEPRTSNAPVGNVAQLLIVKSPRLDRRGGIRTMPC